jgi:segregation and condensation protein A
VSVGSKIDSIMSTLRTKGKHKLFDFYKTATSRSDLVASFLAILELAKDKSIYLTGDGEDIQIELLEGNENT